MTSEAYIVEAVRTPAGRRHGSLADVHPLDLGAEALEALIDRSGATADAAEAIDTVIFGYIDPFGPPPHNIAQRSWATAGLPHHIPRLTINRQCDSSQQAVHFATQAIRTGEAELIVAGGVHSTSRVPIVASHNDPLSDPFSDEGKPWTDPNLGEKWFRNQTNSQLASAEMIADRWSISRSDMEQFAFESHRRAVRAIDGRLFDKEIVPVAGLTQDETACRDASTTRMAGHKPLLEGGKLTAALSSHICDGASALLIASERAVKKYGLLARARIVHISYQDGDPFEMLSAPIEATRFALAKAGLSIREIDTVEINETFASVVLAWLKEFDIDSTRVNPRGGAIALGHPLGATGTKLITTLLHELERTGGRYGLQIMGDDGAQVSVTIIERLPEFTW